ETARGHAAVGAGRAELSVRALVSAATAVVDVGDEVDARRSAVAVRAAREAGLARCLAFARGAFLAGIADGAARAAVVVVGLEIDAGVRAIGQALLARRLALSDVAHEPLRTFDRAHPAVVGIALLVHARRAALDRVAAALKGAAALHANLAG